MSWEMSSDTFGVRPPSQSLISFEKPHLGDKIRNEESLTCEDPLTETNSKTVIEITVLFRETE
jgi:hypothetical protein